jgi:RNA recognition motif-containing protein
LDSHALILQFRLVKNDAKVQKRVGKGKSLTKLLVKNVAFEATKKDLRQLFSLFGQVIDYSSFQTEYVNNYSKVFLSFMFVDSKPCRLKV